MSGHKHKLLAVVGTILAISGVVLVIGGASAVLSDGTVTSDQPENQTVEVDLDFSGGGTTVDANLTRDGTVVQSETVTETTDTTTTATLPLTGLDEGDFSLDVTGADESNVTVTDTRMVTEQSDVLNVSANDSVAVDAGFDADQVTNATVTITDDTGTVQRDEEVSFDPVEAEGGTGYKTVEWTPSSDYGNVTVTIETAPVFGHDAVYSVIESDSGGTGGIIGGAGQTEMIGFTVLIVGVLLAMSRGRI